MNRQNLIELIVTGGVAKSDQLQSKSVQELEKILDDSLIAGIRAEAAQSPAIQQRQRQVDEIQAERIWSRFFFKHPEISDIAANRKMIFDYALSLSYDGVVTFEHLDEAARTLPGLDRQRIKQPPTATNLEQDKKTLRDFCKANRLEPSTAALNLLRQEYGAGFNFAQVGNALRSGLIMLGPASDEILREAQEERQDYLVNQASPQELRQAARTEAEQRRIEFQRAEAERQIAAREQMDAAVGYPPLPEFTGDGQKLDAAWLNRISNTNLQLFKNFMRKYGAANLTARLRGIR